MYRIKKRIIMLYRFFTRRNVMMFTWNEHNKDSGVGFDRMTDFIVEYEIAILEDAINNIRTK
jgi:hypothetical protein